jgi:hypothetical protein
MTSLSRPFMLEQRLILMSKKFRSKGNVANLHIKIKHEKHIIDWTATDLREAGNAVTELLRLAFPDAIDGYNVRSDFAV